MFISEEERTCIFNEHAKLSAAVDMGDSQRKYLEKEKAMDNVERNLTFEFQCRQKQDYDECQDENTCLGGRCSNTIGSYYCTCTPPLVLDSSQHKCVTNTTETLAQNVGLCWQELGEHWVCSRPLLERQMTYAECCCHFGNAWGIDCALCPLRDTDDYAYLCNPARSAEPHDTESYEYIHESRLGSYPMYESDRLYGRRHRPLYGSEPITGHSYESRPFLPPQQFGLQDYMYEGRTYETSDVGSDFAYLSPEGDSRTAYRTRDSLHQPVFEQPSFQGSTNFRPRNTPSGPAYNPDESRSWLRYSDQGTPSFPANPDRSQPGSRPEVLEERYEQFEGLRHEECGILNGCENGRCIRVPEGYTCDCSDGYRLDIAQMACVDINECFEPDDPATICVNGRCVNTDGSYHCVCPPGFVMSPQRNYCILAHPRV
ncbi:latent-transforming growth factor beta-binding protein 4-like [Protopterus annectens]|uniref:latent-transforming growth factor beta-binding protein 4-like n=1 Tax=Protopterus annectens TaxID=7888 RepID=UPI001CF959CF|nr:latent-transforming growth factor beta-binding protein 4-like [Protopterus annectens]